jgi:hypothetical protein
LPKPATRATLTPMFTIEHEFDATIVTLVDDGERPLQEDVTISAFASCVTLEQYDARLDVVQKVTLSMAQLRDLQAALDLPEGSYQFQVGT